MVPEEEYKKIVAHYKQLKGKISGDEILKQFQENYKTFADMFPIVIRYICQLGEYNDKAFAMYLQKCKLCPADNRKEHMVDRNASYVKYLWMQKNRKHPQFSVMCKRVYEDTYKTLNDEYEEFEAMQELAKEKIKEDDARLLAEKKAELKKMLLGRESS